MSRKILGIDIRSDAVSAVLLHSKIKGTSIEAHAFSPLSEPNGIKNGISDCISRLMKEADLSDAACIAACPPENIFYRNLRVPFKEQNKIRQILPYELEPGMPIPVEDLIIDFYLTGRGGPDSLTDLLAAAVEISELKAFMETLVEFKLSPNVVTPGGYAAAFHVAQTADIPDVCFFVDMGRKQCGLFVIISGRICYARSFSLPTGTFSKTAVICHHIQQTTAAVEEILQMELKAGSVLLTGDGIDDKTVFTEVTQKLNIPVEGADLLKSSNMTIKNITAIDWNSLRMDNALALALSEVEGHPILNFRKGSFANKRVWGEHKKQFTRTGVLAGVIALLAFMNILIDNHFLEKKVDRLNKQINHVFTTTFPDIRKIVDPLQQMRVEIENTKKQSVFPESPQQNIRTIDILHDISMLIPGNVELELNRIVIGPGGIQISGNTDSFNSVNNLQRELQNGKLFKVVTIHSANIEKTGNRVNFNLNLQI